MAKIWVLAMLLAGMMACQTNNKSTFSAKGLRFDLPPEWSQQSMDSIGDAAWYVAYEKNDADDYTFLSLTLLEGEADIAETMLLQTESVRENPLFLSWRTRFVAPKPTRFAGFEALKSAYYTTNATKNIQAAIYCFVCGNKTITLLQQGLRNDSIQQLQTLRMFEQSFQCQ